RGPLAIFHEQNAAILSPLRRIPPEILAEIFSWTLPPIREILCRGRLHENYYSPWGPTQISSRRRVVAVLTPLLWS
ncbi:hypothetical protein B0H17DRAFT_905392, partial [Mycena rosella]